MKNGELCVPSRSLQQEDESGAVLPPQEGDEVELTVKGKVSRADLENVYVKPTHVNNEPIGADAEKNPDDEANEGDDLDKEGEELSRMTHEGSDSYPHGSTALMVLLFLWSLFQLLTWEAHGADLEWAKQRTCSGTAVSNYVVLNSTQVQTNAMQVYSVEINNLTGSTLYLMVFDSATNMLANATPHFTAVPIATGAAASKDWGPSGAPFSFGVNVCLSTTPFSLTNASAGGTATVVWSPRLK